MYVVFLSSGCSFGLLPGSAQFLEPSLLREGMYCTLLGANLYK